MPSYELLYFNARGRAELIRLIFAETGVEFDDVRVDAKDWPQRRAETPFGKLPVLRVDGSPIPQSLSIVRFLAREFGLDCKESLSRAFADMLVITFDELLFKLPFMVKDPEQRAKHVGPALEAISEKLTIVENQIKKEDQQYLMGDTLTYADLALFNLFYCLHQFKPDFPSKFSCLKAVAKQVAERPNIKKWIEARPKTEF